jgi:hypothetical protein
MTSHSRLRTALLLLSLSLCASAFSQQITAKLSSRTETGFQYTTLQVPGSSSTVAYGVNNLGDIVGTFVSNSVQSGFIYSAGNFQTIACPGAGWTVAQGINDNGVIVGWCGFQGAQGFIYQNGSYSYVTYPGSSLTALFGINNQGQIVGVCQGCGILNQNGFIYSNGSFTILAARTHNADGINSSSTIAGTACSNRRCKSLYGVVLVQNRRGKWHLQVKIMYPGASATVLNGINDKGDLAGAWGPTPNGQQEGFVYIKSTNTFFGFDIENSGDMAAQGINNLGEIVGFYTVGTTFYGFYGQVTP